MGGDPTPQTHTTNKTKRWWGCRPSNRTKHPHHQKRRPGNTNPQTGQHPPVHSLKETVGSALLSHNPPVAVPSAQKGLTSRFGKDTGCNPLAKTTNTTKISNTPKKGGDHSPVSETIYPLNNPTPKGRVGREPHSGRKHHQTNTNQNQSMQQELLLVIGQLVLVSWSLYNVYTPSLSTR